MPVLVLTCIILTNFLKTSFPDPKTGQSYLLSRKKSLLPEARTGGISIISWNLSTKGQNYAKKLKIGLSFSLVTETNQSPTVGNSRRFSNPQLFLLKYCDDLTKFFLKVKKIVKFVDIIFYINSTLL